MRLPSNHVMETNERELIELQPASLGRALRNGFIEALWDRLGLTVAASLIWTVLVAVPLAFGFAAMQMAGVGGLLLLLILMLIGAPVQAGLFNMAHKVIYRDDPGIGDIFSGFTTLLGPSLRLVAVNIIVMVVLARDALFFAGVLGGTKPSLLQLALGMFCVYLIMAWLMVTMYQLPVMVSQKPLCHKEGALPAIKKSVLLTMHNPGFTIGLFVVILGFSVLCALSVIGALILYGGALPVILVSALRELYIRYEIVEDRVVEDGGWPDR